MSLRGLIQRGEILRREPRWMPMDTCAGMRKVSGRLVKMLLKAPLTYTV